jgi:hypothetical protein
VILFAPSQLKPPQIEFIATPERITSGQPAVLAWQVINATSVRIEPAIGLVPFVDRRQVFPMGSTTWVLRASGPGGTATATVSVVVAASPAPSPLLTVRSFLVAGELEKKRFGLYSYLLFGSPPTDATRERYGQVTAAYLDMFGEFGEYAKHFEPGRLNVTYLPLTQRPSMSRPPVDWVLENYDYARARALLGKLTKPHMKGPYIVSHLETPLSDTRDVNLYLDQDLSSVPPRLIALWVKEFEMRVSTDRSWGEQVVIDFALNLRKAIELVAEEQQVVLAAVPRLIDVVKKTR